MRACWLLESLCNETRAGNALCAGGLSSCTIVLFGSAWTGSDLAFRGFAHHHFKPGTRSEYLILKYRRPVDTPTPEFQPVLD